MKDKTETAYFRSDLFDLRRNLLNAWETFATAKPVRPGKVVPPIRG